MKLELKIADRWLERWNMEDNGEERKRRVERQSVYVCRKGVGQAIEWLSGWWGYLVRTMVVRGQG